MARLFNLESYSELCTHANLYDTKILNPLSYKNSLDKHQESSYRHDSLFLQSLTIEDELIPLKHLGIELSEDGNNLYVIRDRLDSLSLRNFLNPGEKYIYRSVYHYWNHRQQIANNLDLTNSLVIIDLSSTSDEAYCPLQFKQVPNTPYPIPIIDNRREANSDFKLALNVKDIHNNIYRDVARKILSDNFPQLATNKSSVDRLKLYLQEIEVFKLAQSQTESASFSIIIEIYADSKAYYKSVSLHIAILEEIVINRIDIQAIAQFAQKHSEYSFVLISDYNFLPKFRQIVLFGNIFVPENHITEFPQIWQEKQRLNFPLFGQYLDKIKFQIQRDGETQWIEVLSTEEQEHIYYEGDPQTKRFIARIQETGQEYFKLLHPDTVLPIQINDRDYCINGITQEYKILHPLPELEAFIEELRVRIEFIIKLGSVPELKVTERKNKYDIEAELQDYIETKITLNCIPLKTILEYRKQQLKNRIPQSETCDLVGSSLSSIIAVNNLKLLLQINGRVKNALLPIKTYKSTKKTDLFLYVDPNLDYLAALNNNLKKFSHSGVFEIIRKYCNGEIAVHKSQKSDVNKAINNTLNLVGKTYRLSELYLPDFFFSKEFIKNAVEAVGVQYFSFLAKVSIKTKDRATYFKIFSSNFGKNNKPGYQIKDYIWGYSRILSWYSEYYDGYKNTELDYLNHFKSIAHHLLDSRMVAVSGQSRAYQQDAFLALIYLLTFREADPHFCTKDSEEYQLAVRVIEKYKQSLVRLQAFRDRSLNECFEELLNGKSSQDTIRRIIEAD